MTLAQINFVTRSFFVSALAAASAGVEDISCGMLPMTDIVSKSGMVWPEEAKQWNQTVKNTHVAMVGVAMVEGGIGASIVDGAIGATVATGGAAIEVAVPAGVAGGLMMAHSLGMGATAAIKYASGAGMMEEGGGASNNSLKQEYKTPKKNLSAKEGAKDVPSWAKGNKPKKGENGDQFARRLLDEKYGKGNYKTQSHSEYSKIKKWGDRAFE